jgi:hypothetical protein
MEAPISGYTKVTKKLFFPEFTSKKSATIHAQKLLQQPHNLLHISFP